MHCKDNILNTPEINAKKYAIWEDAYASTNSDPTKIAKHWNSDININILSRIEKELLMIYK
jgi:hypothetical protein